MFEPLALKTHASFCSWGHEVSPCRLFLRVVRSCLSFPLHLLLDLCPCDFRCWVWSWCTAGLGLDFPLLDSVLFCACFSPCACALPFWSTRGLLAWASPLLTWQGPLKLRLLPLRQIADSLESALGLSSHGSVRAPLLMAPEPSEWDVVSEQPRSPSNLKDPDPVHGLRGFAWPWCATSCALFSAAEYYCVLFRFTKCSLSHSWPSKAEARICLAAGIAVPAEIWRWRIWSSRLWDAGPMYLYVLELPVEEEGVAGFKKAATVPVLRRKHGILVAVPLAVCSRSRSLWISSLDVLPFMRELSAWTVCHSLRPCLRRLRVVADGSGG